MKYDLSPLKQLCRIDCSEEEEKELSTSISQILDYMRMLKEVDTEHVSPCKFVLPLMMGKKMRRDEQGETLSREEFLENAPDQVGGMIRTPPVIKRDL